MRLTRPEVRLSSALGHMRRLGEDTMKICFSRLVVLVVVIPPGDAEG